MSAICGVMNPEGSIVDESFLRKMCSIVDYRGPDGEGIWCHENVGLGHRLLIATVESVGEKQPLSNGKGLWITADCRIDNREEIAAKYLTLGLSRKENFHNLPDAAYILMAYEIWGDDCPVHLLGDFSFAIWDSQRHRFFCARDPLGIKPFVYYWGGRKFLFASEAKQIFQDPSIPQTPNLRHLADLLVLSISSREDSAYQEIYKLAPGYLILLDKTGLRLKKYWLWDPADEPLSKSTFQDHAAEFRDLFEDAVQKRLRMAPSYRVGSLLSGGLDSSSIVAVAVSLRKACRNSEPFPVFWLDFPEVNLDYHDKKRFDPPDENQYRWPLVHQYGLVSNPVTIQGWGPFQNLLQHLWHFEAPIFFPNLAYFQFLFQKAGSLGIRCLFNGEGGDELFAMGWSAGFLASFKQGGVLGLLKEIKGRHRNKGISYPLLLNVAVRSLIPDFFKAPYRFFREIVPPWINKSFSKKIGLRETMRNSFAENDYARTAYSGLSLWLKAGHTPLVLEAYERAASSCQMEMRFPFLDLRLFQFMAKIPWDQKMRQGITKRLLREALKNTLPPVILQRPRKTNFNPALRTAYERYLLNEIQEAFKNPHPLLREMIVPQKFQEIYEKLFSSRDRKNEHFISILWYLTATDQWLKQDLDYSKKYKEKTNAFKKTASVACERD